MNPESSPIPAPPHMKNIFNSAADLARPATSQIYNSSSQSMKTVNFMMSYKCDSGDIFAQLAAKIRFES